MSETERSKDLFGFVLYTAQGLTSYRIEEQDPEIRGEGCQKWQASYCYDDYYDEHNQDFDNLREAKAWCDRIEYFWQCASALDSIRRALAGEAVESEDETVRQVVELKELCDYLDTLEQSARDAGMWDEWIRIAWFNAQHWKNKDSANG